MPKAIAEFITQDGKDLSNICWLAVLSLQQIGDWKMITAIARLRAFTDQAPSVVAREATAKTLGELESYRKHTRARKPRKIL